MCRIMHGQGASTPQAGETNPLRTFDPATSATDRLRITAPKSGAYLFAFLFPRCSMLLDQ
jgi:hypothetical protein